MMSSCRSLLAIVAVSQSLSNESGSCLDRLVITTKHCSQSSAPRTRKHACSAFLLLSSHWQCSVMAFIVADASNEPQAVGSNRHVSVHVLHVRHLFPDAIVQSSPIKIATHVQAGCNYLIPNKTSQFAKFQHHDIVYGVPGSSFSCWH